MKKEYKEKKQKLDNARKSLKHKFIGLDPFIDKVMDQITPWFVFEIPTETPLVINLWGITGTGKSEFVNTLCDLLDIKRITFDSQQFLGSNFATRNFSGTLKTDDRSAIIVEEFHRIKTVREQDETVVSDQRYILWEILSGTLNLRYDLAGVKGMFVAYEKRKWIKEITEHRAEALINVVDALVDNLARYERYPLSGEMSAYLEKFSQEEHKTPAQIMTELEEFVNNIKLTHQIKTNKNIIFVLGNLDKAYRHIVEDLETSDADEVVKHMSQISSQECKESLLKLFNPEQVARLGSNHFIMPTLTKQGYKEFIRNKIHSFISEYYHHYGSYFMIDESVIEMLYDQIVIPTQGVRNVLSGLNTLLYSPVSLALPNLLKYCEHHPILLKYDKGKYLFSVDTMQFICPIDFNDKSHYSEEFLNLVAHHEAGHAVVYALLNKQSPLRVVAATNSSRMGGYVKKKERDFDTKQSLQNDIKVALAGFYAEKVIFGEDNVSSGSYSDLNKATNILSKMVNELGLGLNLSPMRIGTPMNPAFLRSSEKEKDKEIYKQFEQLSKETEKMVQDNKELIQKLASILIVKKSLDEKELDQFFSEYRSEEDEEIDNMFAGLDDEVSKAN